MNHNNDRLFQCEICEKQFKSIKTLENHKIKFHKKIYECSECKKKFVTEINWQKHINKKG